MDQSAMSLQPVHVNVCGQQLTAACDGGPPSLNLLKDTVKHGIGLNQDWMEFFDNDGKKLLSDAEVYAAMSDRRTPIYATISGHAVHEFEQRREEFAQMQWKIVRDQLTVLSLQLGNTQTQVKSLREQVQEDDRSKSKMIAEMKDQLVEGLMIVDDCKTSAVNSEELINKVNDSVRNMGLLLGKETDIRKNCIEDLEFKMKRQNETQQQENTKLSEALDACVDLLNQADEQLGQDVKNLQKRVDETRNLAHTMHEDALKKLDEAQMIATQALGEASNLFLKQAHDDAERQVNEVTKAINQFETRIVKTECLARDTASKWSESHQKVKEQYNSAMQAIEQCRVQNRTTDASTRAMTEKIEVHTEAMQAQYSGLKKELPRECKAREEQAKRMQQDINALVKTSMAELEVKLNTRIDKESDARRTNIVQALNDMGKVLEKEIPSKLREESKRAEARGQVQALLSQVPSSRQTLGGTGQTRYDSPNQSWRVTRSVGSVGGMTSPRLSARSAQRMSSSPTPNAREQYPPYTGYPSNKAIISTTIAPNQKSLMYGSSLTGA